MLFTAPRGQNVIEGNDKDDSCVLIRQGAHHVIVRGLVLKDCKRYGVLIQRQGGDTPSDAQTHDIVIEDNEITGWGGFENVRKDTRLADNDGAVHCAYYRETDDARRPDRIIVQGNRMRDPRHGANPWRSTAHGHKHPFGPLGVNFDRCGRNHVIRYNEIRSQNGNFFNDGIGGADNFSTAGFPWADADIYGNRVSEVYDDAIEAEGANRNVRIWGNHFRRVYVAIGNAATVTGPLYVWRNVASDMARMYQPEGNPRPRPSRPLHQGGEQAAGFQRRARLLLPQHRAGRGRRHRALRRPDLQLRRPQQPVARVARHAAGRAVRPRPRWPGRAHPELQRPRSAAAGRRAASRRAADAVRRRSLYSRSVSGLMR